MQKPPAEAALPPGPPFAEAQWRDIGILNGGTYYMGLLADPVNGWSLGFKKTLIEQYPKLVDLARRIQTWCEIELPKERNIQPISIRTLALQFSLRHEAISSTVFGCRSAREVDEACDAFMTEIFDQISSTNILRKACSDLVHGFQISCQDNATYRLSKKNGRSGSG